MASPKDDWIPHWLPLIEKDTLDTLRVADIHQRGAFRPTEALMFAEISRVLQNFGAALTWLGDEKPFDDPAHNITARNIAIHLSDIISRAKIAGAKEVVLPLRQNTPLANYVGKIAQRFDLDQNFRFRDQSYDLDLGACGPVEKKQDNHPLQIGKSGVTVRGLWDIDDELKYKWDNESRKTKRTSGPKLQH